MGGAEVDNPEFKKVLRELLDLNGGVGIQNVKRISEKLQPHEDAFSSTGRLLALLRGLLQPTEQDRRALSLVLEPVSDRWLSEIWRLEELESRRLARFAFAHMRSHVLAKAFVDYVLVEASFRNQDHTESSLAELHTQFRNDREIEDEIELFDLKV